MGCRKSRPDITGVFSIPVVDSPTSRGQPARGCLVFVSGEDLGKTLHLDGTLDIGRTTGTLLLAETDVSRRHARIRRGFDGFVIEDLDSANGTFVNGERVDGVTQLRPGDRIQIGRTIMMYSHWDELQGRMEQIQRLEAMGTLAGGIAHDFNNALAVIVANLDLVGEALRDDADDAREGIEAMRRATSSASNLVRRLLRLGSTDPMTIAPVAVDAIVEATAALVRRKLPSRIAIALDLQARASVLGSFDELQQALINLCYNAGDAMPDGGSLSLATRVVTFGPSEAVEHGLASGGRFATITVTDTGTGISPLTLARIFEPFFTTKGRDKGTGLGLAMTHSAVRRHGGAIEVASTLGAGTTFTIYLMAS